MSFVLSLYKGLEIGYHGEKQLIFYLGRAKDMRLLLTLDEHNYTEDMPVYERYNVRAIIQDGTLFAMERSRIGEYKFSGGTVDAGESFEQALCREVLEETGLFVIPESIQPVGEIIEKRLDRFELNTIYLCHSLYYTCSIEPNRMVEETPCESEREQGYHLAWAEAEEIIRANRQFSKKKWIARDTRFLEMWIKGEV